MMKIIGDVCTNCGHPFIRSFLNFEILPLVEFVPDDTVTGNNNIKLFLLIINR